MDSYMPAANTPAGERDTSDAFGPTVVGVDGIEVPRAVFHSSDGYVVHGEMTGDTVSPPPLRDTDSDDGLPDVPRYEGPQVADQVAVVNPSAGDTGPLESGMADVNPQGPAPVIGNSATATSTRQVYPDTTVG